MAILPLGLEPVVARGTEDVAPPSTLVPAAPPPPDAPAADGEAIANARERMSLETSIRATKGNVVWLDAELSRLETDNQRLYQASQQTIQNMQTELASVLTDRRVHSDDRVSAFFGIVQNNGRLQRLETAWRAHRSKQVELGATLAALKTTERELAAPAETMDARLVLFQQRIHGLEELLANLEQQAALLREMVAQASGTGRALEGLQLALDASLKETRAWISRARGEAAEDLLARVLDVAGFAAMLVMPVGALAAMTPLISLLKDLVAGEREPIEAFVWRTLGSLAAGALVRAGVGDLAARAIVSALREGGRAAGGRDDVAAAVAGAVLTDAQALVIDFLAKRGSEALPLAALAKAVVALGQLRKAEAEKIVASLSQPGHGVDAALATLEAAASPSA